MAGTNRISHASGGASRGADLASEHQLLATLPAMLFTSRPDGLWDYVNPPFCAYTGYPPAALTGLGWVDAVHADDRATSLTCWQTAIGRGTPLHVEHRLQRIDGNHQWFRTDCTPQRNAAGAIIRWAGIATPVAMPPDLANEHKLRRSVDLARDSIIAIVAHELRAPVTVLLGQAQLQQRRLATRPYVDPSDQRAANILVDQAVRLTQLIHALLNTAAIEHGQLQISLTPLDLAALVRRVVQSLQATLPSHTLRLIADAAPLWVAGDALRLEQVLQNLLQNAVKYSPAGSEIALTVASQDNQVQIAVLDHGSGIAASARPYLFQRFVRAKRESDSAVPGLGLGLYISKAIMDLHGGSIEVESAVGAGSTFTLLLPQIPPPGML